LISIKIEVFTPEDVTSFLTNGKKDADTAAEKKYIKVPIGKVLHKAFPGRIKKDTKIKLIEAGTNFSKIQIVTSTNNGKEYFAPAGQGPSVLNEIYTLTSDLTEIYEEKPDRNKLTDTEARKDVFNKKGLKSVKDSSEVTFTLKPIRLQSIIVQKMGENF
jgi:hypothetical protein